MDIEMILVHLDTLESTCETQLRMIRSIRQMVGVTEDPIRQIEKNIAPRQPVVVTPKAVGVADKILAILKENPNGLASPQIAEILTTTGTRTNDSSASACISRLTKLGLVVRTGPKNRGIYFSKENGLHKRREDFSTQEELAISLVKKAPAGVPYSDFCKAFKAAGIENCDEAVKRCLERLRRRDVFNNLGTRRNPIYVLTDKELDKMTAPEPEKSPPFSPLAIAEAKTDNNAKIIDTIDILKNSGKTWQEIAVYLNHKFPVDNKEWDRDGVRNFFRASGKTEGTNLTH